MTASSDSRDVNKFWEKSAPLIPLLILSLFLNAVSIETAPLSDEELTSARQTQLSEYYGGSLNSTNCYYNFQHYNEGDRIITNEPCLNCTCHKKMLMCYLRVCPFTKAVGQDCTVEKRPDQCCPVITCPEVPVQLLTSSTTSTEVPPTESSSAIAHHNTYGCTIGNAFYPDGAQVPSDPKNPCELCYCIRNRTACILQQCTLNVGGCQAIHQPEVCCPVRYDCNYDDLQTSPEPAGTGAIPTTTQSPQQCDYHDQLFNDGELIPLMHSERKSCEKCYCMRGEIVCAVQECGDPLEGKDCEPIPPPEGQCCPTTYLCANETVPINSLMEILKPDLTHDDVTDSSFHLSEQELSTRKHYGTSIPNLAKDEAQTEETSTDEPDTADSKPSGTQIIPEEDVTRVTSIAETHTEISISTKQGSESTELPTVLNEEVETQRPNNEEENVPDSSSPPEHTSDHYENDSDVVTDKPTESPELELSTELHVMKPHPIEIDDLENSEGEHSKPHEHADLPMHVESDEPSEGHDDFELEADDLEKPQPTESPEQPIETMKPDLSVQTHTPEIAVETTTLKELDVEEHKISSSSEENVINSESPIVEHDDNETGSSTKLESSTDKSEFDMMTRVELVTELSKIDDATAPPEPSATESPIPTTSNHEQESIKFEHNDSTEKVEVSSETVTTEINNEQPHTEDHSESIPSVSNPLSPEIIGVEHDAPENLDNEEHPVFVTEKPPSPESQSVIETDADKDKLEVPSPTTISVDEAEPGRTTVKTEIEVDGSEQSENEQTTAIGMIEQQNEDQTVSNGEIPKTDTITSSPNNEQHVSTESVIDNEISSDVEHQTSPPAIHKEDKQPIITEQPIVEKGVVPGEGSCLVEGRTYSDGETVPATDPCNVECKCRSSIVQCETIVCPPPPPHMKNCIPVNHGENTCCPTYSCDDEKEKISLETHNQLANPEESAAGEKAENSQAVENPNVHSEEDSVQISTTSLPAVEPEQPVSEVSTETQPPINKVENNEQIELVKEPEEPLIKPGVVSPQIPEFIEHDDHQSPEEPTHIDNEPEPVNNESEPVNNESEPANNEPEPAKNESEPANNESEPANNESEPANNASEPANNESEPANNESEPANNESEPANNESKPANNESEPANNESKPVNNEPETVTEPEPVNNEPLTEEPTTEAAGETIKTEETHSPAEENTNNNSEISPSADNDITTEKEIVRYTETPHVDVITELSPVQETEQPTSEHSTEYTQKLEHNDDLPEHSQSSEEDDKSNEAPTSEESGEHETTTFEIPRPSNSPSKFEEYDIQKPTTLSPELPHLEDDSTSPATEKSDTPVKVEDEDHPTYPPEPIEEEHLTESNVKSDKHEEYTTTPISLATDVNTPENDEMDHQLETTPSPLHNEEHDHTNNVLGPILSAELPAGAEHDNLPQGVPVEEEPTPTEEDVHTEPNYEEEPIRQTTMEVEEVSTKVYDHEHDHHIVQSTEVEPIEEVSEKINEPVENVNVHEPDENLNVHEPIENVNVHEPVERYTTTISTEPEHLTEHIHIQPTETIPEHHDETTLPPQEQPEDIIGVTEKSDQEHSTVSSTTELVSETVVDHNEEIPHPEHDVGSPESQTYDNQVEPHKEQIDEKPEIQESTPHPAVETTPQTVAVEHHEEVEDDKKDVLEAEVKPEHETSENEDAHPQYTEEGDKPEEGDSSVSSSVPNIIEELTTKHTPISSTHSQESEGSALPESVLPHVSMPNWTQKPFRPDPTTEPPHMPEEEEQPFRPSGGDLEYEEEEENAFGPGTCRYGGKVFVSAQQVPRDNPCDFCFCFRSDIICLQQSCPPPIHGCRQESIQGFCCPRYECPVSMAMTLNLTTSTTTTTTTLPPHFFSHAYRGSARRTGCQVQGHAYRVGEEITSASGPCLQCICGANGQMKCDPTVCSPEPMLRKMIEAAVSRR